MRMSKSQSALYNSCFVIWRRVESADVDDFSKREKLCRMTKNGYTKAIEMHSILCSIVHNVISSFDANEWCFSGKLYARFVNANGAGRCEMSSRLKVLIVCGVCIGRI